MSDVAPDDEPISEPRQRRVRLRYVAAALVCAGAVVWMLWAGLSDSLVYLRPVSEAVERRADQGAKTFRMGGIVVAGSVVPTNEGVIFELAEGGATVAVVHEGDPPDLFGDGAPVVVEGRWAPDDSFDSDRLLIRHGNEYSEYETPVSSLPSSGVEP